MALVNQYVEWGAGAGTAPKYSVAVYGDIDAVGQTEDSITVHFKATITIVNYPYQSQNSWPASDFAILTAGDKTPGDYSFSSGQSYYEASLPLVPNAPQSYVDAVITEFRGDTYATAGPNRTSLYVKGSGNVLNDDSSGGSKSFNVDLTYSVKLTGDRNQPVLIWQSSGANNSTDYNWLTKQVWVSLVDLDYRPGKIWSGNEWLSHNRSAGFEKIYTSSTNTREMRTENGGVGIGNPPLIYSGRWLNQRKIGKE